MSSHREAPEISKDPVADNTDTYAFVSPDNAETVTLITNYLPREVPAGGPELLRVRQRRPLLDLCRQRRRRRSRHHLPVQLRVDVPRPQHVPLQHRPDNRPQRRDLEQPPDLHGDPHRGSLSAAARTVLEHETVRHDLPARPATSARARPRNTPSSQRQRCTRSPSGADGLRGSAQRPVLRRPRLVFDLGDLRPFQSLHLIKTV